MVLIELMIDFIMCLYVLTFMGIFIGFFFFKE